MYLIISPNITVTLFNMKPELFSVFSILTNVYPLESDQTVPNITTFTTPTNNTTDSSSSSPCTCPTTSPKTTATPSTSSSAPALDLITIKWTENCKGEVLLILNYTSNSPVCYDNKTKVQSLLGNVCKNKKDCEDPPKWERSMTKTICYHLTESMRKEERKYETLKVQCTGLVFSLCVVVFL